MVKFTEMYRIQREGGTPILIDEEDGQEITRFTRDWTDAQIHKAAELMNRFYNHGVTFGRLSAKREIKAALGINE